MSGSGAVYRSGPSARGSGPLCSTMPAAGYGQGRWLRTFLIARGPRADQPDDRPVHLSLRAETRVNLARPEAECPLGQAPRGEAEIHDSPTQITGTWRGNSECVLKNSPCRDEINVYRFSEIAGKPGWFSGIGSKLVDGKEVSRPVCHPFVCVYRPLHHRHSHCITSTL